MIAFNITDSNIHPFQYAQILLLEVEEVTILSKYTDYTNIFFPNFATELSEYININDHPINQINNKQPPYSPIYSLEPMKLKILKTYIKTNLANGFIRLSKLFTNALIPLIYKKIVAFDCMLIIKVLIT